MPQSKRRWRLSDEILDEKEYIWIDKRIVGLHDKLRFLDWGRRVKELDEPVEERGGQGFPAFSLGSLVLNSYEPEVGMFGDGGVEFWKEDLASVIENGVQALQDGLAGQIQVVYHQPLPLFQTVHQHSVLPFKLHAFSFPVITFPSIKSM